MWSSIPGFSPSMAIMRMSVWSFAQGIAATLGTSRADYSDTYSLPDYTHTICDFEDFIFFSLGDRESRFDELADPRDGLVRRGLDGERMRVSSAVIVAQVSLTSPFTIVLIVAGLSTATTGMLLGWILVKNAHMASLLYQDRIPEERDKIQLRRKYEFLIEQLGAITIEKIMELDRKHPLRVLFQHVLEAVVHVNPAEVIRVQDVRPKK